jgi:hypothetical protein
MNKIFRILELTWLFAALCCAGISVYYLINHVQRDAGIFAFLFLISSILFLLRRYQRVNQDKINKIKEAEKNTKKSK